MNYSERFIAIVGGTTPTGADPHSIMEAIRKNGLLPQEDLPFDETIDSREKFFSPNPMEQKYLDKAKEFLNGYTFLHEYVGTPGQEIKHDILKAALKRSPLGIAVYAWEQNDKGEYIRTGQDCHWVELIAFDGDNPICFDSYEEKGSELKKLSPDYTFFYAKRIYIQQLKKNKKTHSKKSLRQYKKS